MPGGLDLHGSPEVQGTGVEGRPALGRPRPQSPRHRAITKVGSSACGAHTVVGRDALHDRRERRASNGYLGVRPRRDRCRQARRCCLRACLRAGNSVVQPRECRNVRTNGVQGKHQVRLGAGRTVEARVERHAAWVHARRGSLPPSAGASFPEPSLATPVGADVEPAGGAYPPGLQGDGHTGRVVPCDAVHVTASVDVAGMNGRPHDGDGHRESARRRAARVAGNVSADVSPDRSCTMAGGLAARDGRAASTDGLLLVVGGAGGDASHGDGRLRWDRKPCVVRGGEPRWASGRPSLRRPWTGFHPPVVDPEGDLRT